MFFEIIYFILTVVVAGLFAFLVALGFDDKKMDMAFVYAFWGAFSGFRFWQSNMTYSLSEGVVVQWGNVGLFDKIVHFPGYITHVVFFESVHATLAGIMLVMAAVITPSIIAVISTFVGLSIGLAVSAFLKRLRGVER